MASIPPVTVVIPTWNAASELGRTLASLREQDYEPSKISFCFVDFGSTDGTLQMLLDLPAQHTAIISCPGRPLGRTMPARALRMLSMQNTPGRRLVLWPGDVLYGNALSRMEHLLAQAWRERLAIDGLVAEVDVLEANDIRVSQRPLFTSAALLRGYSPDSLAYVDRGYRHQILLYGAFTDSIDKIGVYRSYVRHWNQLHYIGFYHNILYTPEKLACVRQFSPADEVDNLLFRFETGLSAMLGAKYNDMLMLDSHFEEAFRRSLGKYALWRAWLTHRRGEHKTAEDCLILSRIINLELEQKEAWRRMERLLAAAREEDDAWLAACFAREEAPVPPELPFGGLLRRWQRRWRLKTKRKSAFAH